MIKKEAAPKLPQSATTNKPTDTQAKQTIPSAQPKVIKKKMIKVKKLVQKSSASNSKAKKGSDSKPKPVPASEARKVAPESSQITAANEPKKLPVKQTKLPTLSAIGQA